MAGTSYRRIEHRHGAAFLNSAIVCADNSCDTVILAPNVVGVCRSDLREISGMRFGRRDFGHELVGTVLAAPAALAALQGRTVLFDPHPTLTARTSGFADLIELTGSPRQLAAALVPVPEGLPDRIAVFGEPLACAVHCVTRLHQITTEIGLDPQTPIAVLGAGMAGTLICTVLTTQGHRCVLANHHPERVEFLLDRHVLPREVLGCGSAGPPFDRVVLATAEATPDYLATGMRLLTENGLLLIFAGTHPGTYIDGVDIDRVRREQLVHPIHAWDKPLTVAGTHGATRTDFTETLDLLTAPPNARHWSPAIGVQRLITQTIGLDAAADYLTANAAHGVLGKTIVHIRPPTPEPT